MNEKRSLDKRGCHPVRQSDRNVVRNVKEFSCNTIGRNDKLEQSKNIRADTDDRFSYGNLATGRYRLSEISEGATSDSIENRSHNFNSKSFSSSNNSAIETKPDGDNLIKGKKKFLQEKSDSVSSSLKTNRKLGHLPFRTVLSQESITNLSKTITGLKEELIHSGHGSKSPVASKSGSMTSRRLSSAPTKKKPNPIILPREQFQVLQERIKAEIENLKYLENSVACDKTVESRSKEEKIKENDNCDENSEEIDELDELGSDIQYLSAEERQKLYMKYSKKYMYEVKDESKSIKTKVNNILSTESTDSEVGIITIDLTKECTPVEGSEKTDVEGENDYPSLDLDYGSKIDWEDGKKILEIKHSTGGSEKQIVNLDIDQSKLTSETTKKITDIKNRLARSLSIGLSHKEADKELIGEQKMKTDVINLPSGEGGSILTGECEDSVEEAEILELASLRCTSERTEVIADRERRRKRRCADYPGLAFGFSIFSSDTMMKFSIIKNELHNIMNTQLKRVCIY